MLKEEGVDGTVGNVDPEFLSGGKDGTEGEPALDKVVSLERDESLLPLPKMDSNSSSIGSYR